jgi:hypothetical protein
MKVKNILVIVLGLMLCSAAHAQSGSDVLAALKKYDNAWNSKDSKTVDGILHKNYQYFSSEGGTSSRTKTLEFLNSPTYVLTFVERSEISTLTARNTVVVSSRWKGKGTYDKQPINDDQRCSLVFVKEGSVWQLLSEHCTQIVKK